MTKEEQIKKLISGNFVVTAGISMDEVEFQYESWRTLIPSLPECSGDFMSLNRPDGSNVRIKMAVFLKSMAIEDINKLQSPVLSEVTRNFLTTGAIPEIIVTTEMLEIYRNINLDFVEVI